MRLIGHFDNDKDARKFGDFLYVQGMETEFERDGSRWAVWIRSDDHVASASKLLEEYRVNPNDPKFEAGAPAEKLRQRAKSEDEEYQKRVVPGKKLFPGLTGRGFGFVSYGLIACCIVIFLMSGMGEDRERIAGLFITWEGGLREIKRGEVWRLVSPILIHFSIMHILFNMLWMRDLGSLFEGRLGSGYFAVFVVIVGAVSNYAEYAISHHPMFGGMSGVVYGLIGYVWIRGHFDPGAGLHLDRQSLIFALIFFVLCFTRLLGPIANYAHGSGLLLGMAWAFVDSRRK
ncbi:MAG TPA: rhomboid family intramembrane serine protease [Methylomirabilota bacterium]|nr:rhomboid family intramembrane serine protease [Methylomirabilota bacterium]